MNSRALKAATRTTIKFIMVAGATTYTYLDTYTVNGICDTEYVSCEGEDDSTGDYYPPQSSATYTQENSTEADIEATVSGYDEDNGWVACDCDSEYPDGDNFVIDNAKVTNIVSTIVNDCAP